MIDKFKRWMLPRKERLKLQRQAAYAHFWAAGKDTRAQHDRWPALRDATNEALRGGA